MTFSGPFFVRVPLQKSLGRDGFRPVLLFFFKWFKVEISFSILFDGICFQILPEDSSGRRRVPPGELSLHPLQLFSADVLPFHVTHPIY